MTDIRSENAAPYAAVETLDDAIVRKALLILEARLKKPESYFTSPDAASKYLVLKLAERESEVFGVMFLDNRHGLIAVEELFQGTIDGASVWTREIVKAVLKHNAAAVILFHNHPSGYPLPSDADMRITRRIRDALALIDVRTLDHLIVGGADTYSFAESGEI